MSEEFKTVPVADDYTGRLIDAANVRADIYNGDDRECIKTDVMNSFYAGAEWARKESDGEIERIRAALDRIARWHGEFQETGRYWDEPNNTQPMSYGGAYGSNGERDYMRQVAREALDGK